MVEFELDRRLRKRHLKTLKLRVKDQALFEQAKEEIEVGRDGFKYDWDNTQGVWQMLKASRPIQLMMMRKPLEKAKPLDIIPPYLPGYSIFRPAVDGDEFEQCQAVRYCDLQLENISRCLEDMRLFEEKDVESTIYKRLKGMKKRHKMFRRRLGSRVPIYWKPVAGTGTWTQIHQKLRSAWSVCSNWLGSIRNTPSSPLKK